MRAVLEGNQWGYQSTNGQTVALFCPMCQAMIPPAGDPFSYTPKQQHIDWHVATAEAIRATS
jgi:hypothetical protein